MIQLIFVAEATESLPMFDLALQTFLQMLPHLVSFGVLAFVFAKFLYKPVKNILNTRAERVVQDIQEAAENKASSEEMRMLYESKLGIIEQESALILEDARKEAAARVDFILSEAKTEAGNIRNRAARDIESERERVKAEMHQAIIDISTEMAARLVSATIDESMRDRFFDEAVGEIEEALEYSK